MAIRPKPTARPASASAAPAADTVFLRCEDLGETRPFAPDHAARILAVQERQHASGDSTWQPVASDSSASA